MTTLTMGLLAAGGAAGLLLIVVGLRGTTDPERAPRPERRRRGLRGDSAQLTRNRLIAAAGFVAGLLLWLITGWFAFVVLVPIAAVGAPYLLRNTDKHTIRRLDALEEWTRSLAGLLLSGNSLEHSIGATATTAPDAIETEVATLARRLRAGMSTQDALRAFADDVDDPTGDLITARLLQASARRGSGVAVMLSSLAESVSEEVNARRSVETERVKPRTTARWASIISAAALAYLFTRGDYVAPYQSPVGQLLLIVLLGAFGGALVWMKRAAGIAEDTRFISSRTTQRSPR